MACHGRLHRKAPRCRTFHALCNPEPRLERAAGSAHRRGCRNARRPRRGRHCLFLLPARCVKQFSVLRQSSSFALDIKFHSAQHFEKLLFLLSPTHPGIFVERYPPFLSLKYLSTLLFHTKKIPAQPKSRAGIFYLFFILNHTVSKRNTLRFSGRKRLSFFAFQNAPAYRHGKRVIYPFSAGQRS